MALWLVAYVVERLQKRRHAPLQDEQSLETADADPTKV
jgi:hypothetical protein